MSDEYLRDNHGKILGRITKSGATLELRDAKGKILGHFDSRANETRDAKGKIVGKGNLLTMLLR